MIASANCQHCGNDFEFEAGNRTEFCPHCGKETRVVPVGNLTPPRATSAKSVKWGWLWILIGAAAICGLLIFFSGWIGDEVLKLFPFVGSAFNGLLLLIGFILGVFWTFFPWFVYFKMERMNRLLEKIEQNTRR